MGGFLSSTRAESCLGVPAEECSLSRKQLAHLSFDELFECDAPLSNTANQAQTGPVGLEDLFGNEMTDLAGSAIYLVGSEPLGASYHFRDRLAAELDAIGQCDDLFLAKLSQRLHMLECIHKAIFEQSDDAKSPWSTSVTSVPKNAGQKAALDYAIEFGIRFLYATVDYIQERNDDSLLRRSLLSDLICLLGESVPSSMAQQQESKQSCLRSVNTTTVTDTACKIITECALTSISLYQQQPRRRTFPSKHHSLGSTALLRLASARGRASDLLCIIRTLIQQDQSFDDVSPILDSSRKKFFPPNGDGSLKK